MRIIKKYGRELLYKELRKSYNFFIKEANTDKKSDGYGLIIKRPIIERIKQKKDYKEIKDIIYTYCGTLFTYRYSHAWIDFRNLIDNLML